MAAIFADYSLNVVTLSLIIALWLWAPLAKQVSAQVFSLKSREFVESSHAKYGSELYIAKDIAPCSCLYFCKFYNPAERSYGI